MTSARTLAPHVLRAGTGSFAPGAQGCSWTPSAYNFSLRLGTQVDFEASPSRTPHPGGGDEESQDDEHGPDYANDAPPPSPSAALRQPTAAAAQPGPSSLVWAAAAAAASLLMCVLAFGVYRQRRRIEQLSNEKVRLSRDPALPSQPHPHPWPLSRWLSAPYDGVRACRSVSPTSGAWPCTSCTRHARVPRTR